MNKVAFALIASLLMLMSACDKKETKGQEFMYEVDEFADLQILRYQYPDLTT